MKVTIIGAGSSFTEPILVDILRIADIEHGTIALVDIDKKRLELAYKLVKKILEITKKDWKVIASENRREVIANSDFIINQIEVMGLTTVKNEYEIPLKYGVKQCIGDTLGPGGLFKSLRTLPAWLEIIKDIEDLCPKATILNYTNPMSAMVLATTRVTELPIVGLCHSVQGTTQRLAEYLSIPYEELKWRCAGINHMAWITELNHKGENMYPKLLKKIEDPEFLAQDPVRFDAMKYLGVFVTESSGHFSEYVPYYRKRQDLIDEHCSVGYNGATGFYANEWPSWRARTDQRMKDKIDGKETIKLEPSNEYAATIIESIVKNEPAVIYGNVLNNGLISNLPSDGVVEVACMIDRNGINPCYYGKLPEHLAALNRSNMSFFELTVEAVLQKDKDMAIRALMMDPLTAAVCSLKEIKDMFNELYEVEREYIAELK